MYRIRLAVLFGVLVTALVFGAWALKVSGQEEQLETEVKPGLLVSLEGFQLLHAKRMEQADRFLSDLSETTLPKVLGVLTHHQDALIDLQKKVRNEHGIVDFTQHQIVDQMVRKVYRQNAKLFAKLADELDSVLAGMPNRTEYIQKLGLVFSSCALQDDPWDICYFKFFYTELVGHALPELDVDHEGLPELFVLLDPDGRTSRVVYENFPQFAQRTMDSALDDTARDQMEATSLERFGDHIRPGFNQLTPVVDVLVRGDRKVASSYFVMGDAVYAVIGRRLGTLESGAPLALAGYQLDNVRAQQDAARIVGVRPSLRLCLSAVKDKTEPVSDALCDRERARQSKGLSFFFRAPSSATFQQLGSSLPPAQAEHLHSLCRTESDSCPSAEGGVLTDGDLLGVVGSIPVDSLPTGASLRVLVSSTYSGELRPFEVSFIHLVLVAFASLVAGIIIMVLLARHMNKPFSEMDQVANTIIGGNFEADFPFQYPDPLPRAMGQSLTIMKRVLLGQPLPEDQELESSWGATLAMRGMDALSEDTDEGLSGPEAMEEVDPSAVPSSPTEYYHRLFREYVDARRKTGAAIDGITYVKFVEKAARVEKGLRDRTGAARIVLRVEVKDGQVVLVPMRVKEPDAD